MLKMWVPLMVVLTLVGCAARGGGRASAPGAIAIAVTEKGFEPEVVTVEHAQPVTLVVTRKTDKTCAKEFVMAAHDIRKDLPLDQPVEITFTPTESGELRYACGMDMIAGKIVVK